MRKRGSSVLDAELLPPWLALLTALLMIMVGGTAGIWAVKEGIPSL